MSLRFIEEQIRKFLSSDTPEVIAVKGQWGVGKTYSWNTFLEKSKKENLIKLQKYSYISLFGINSLDTLKYALFENSIPINLIGTEPNLKTLKENTTSVLSGYGKLAGGLLKNTSIAKNVTPVIENLAFIGFSKTIICIDDLERKGNGLSLRDVLGLVSLLREHKNCKIILLLNDGTEETKEFNTYKEKVLDVELTFNPTAAESAGIAYNGSKNFHAQLIEYTSKLEIKNIRILKKIERNVSFIEPFFKDCELSIFIDAIATIVLYSWCFYSFKGDKDVPDLEFITSEEFYLYGYINKEEVEEKKLAWKKIISRYGYNNTDGVDHELQSLVKNGYIDDSSMSAAIHDKNEKIKAGISRDAFSNAWRLYHDSLDDNEEEVVTGLVESFRDNFKTISPNNLDSLISLLKYFERNDEVQDVISIYIEGRKHERELFNIKNGNLFRDLENGELIDAFHDAYTQSESKGNESLLELLIRISEKNGWGNKDVEQLASASIEDYYCAFKKSAGHDVASIVAAALQFQHFNGNDDYKKIIHNVKWALTAISYEGRINLKRIGNFEVDLCSI